LIVAQGRAYEDNRRVAIDDALDADPVATCVRELMAERSSWAGRAVDLPRRGADRSRADITVGGAGWCLGYVADNRQPNS
jgi:hypothetical protein